ncbi:MAG: bifunctional precorrin-2 dehydrogenase/sirohydrochlorin ferrochelatase [bacterium]
MKRGYERTTYYPVHLDLVGKGCVVVGGGKVAERKVRSLLSARADVTVVSPEVTRGIANLARRGCIRHLNDRYQQKFLRGAWLVIAATDDAATNARIAKDATRLRALVNAVDMPDASTFIVPAVLRRGSLSICISTDGQSPLLARVLKERCSACIGREYATLARMLGALRRKPGVRAANPCVRATLYENLIRSPLLYLLRDGKTKEARRLVQEIMDSMITWDSCLPAGRPANNMRE